jgi:SAM-dependent methyltransferase
MNTPLWGDADRGDRLTLGEQPSEVARAVKEYFEREKIPTAGKRMIDIGCGYGRDTFYLSSEWRVRMLGVDSHAQAIEMARARLPKQAGLEVEFRRARFQDLSGETFDLAYAANLYQILPPAERAALCRAVEVLLKPGGWFLLGTHSSRDPQHAGKGTAVPGDANSWMDKTYIHLSTREELETGFSFLEIRSLSEREYSEPRAGGEPHHHISWILIGQRKP